MAPVNEKEQWLGLVAYPGYDVSSWGRVRSYWGKGRCKAFAETPQVMATFIQKRGGYVSLVLTVNGKPRNVRVHQLVLTAFVGPCPDGMEGCHFPDRDRTNNWVGNLRWDTKVNNSADRRIHGTMPSKLTPADIRRIRELAAAGASQRGLAKTHGVSQPTISRIVNMAVLAEVA